jgi:hypothetical protein
MPGMHKFAVELVNNDHTPLIPFLFLNPESESKNSFLEFLAQKRCFIWVAIEPVTAVKAC